MSGSRGVELPFEHLTAELAAAPFAAPSAFDLSIVELSTELKGPDAALWRAVEIDLTKSFPSYSVDELTALRDWLWFQEKGDKPVGLADYLRRVANATLIFSGNVFRPRLPPWSDESTSAPTGSDDARARRFWRWVSFALPPDLLMASHPAPGAVSAEVEMVSPILARILKDRGYVEPHMHVGAASEYQLVWIATLHALADPQRIKHDSFVSPGAEWNEGLLLSEWLVRAAIGRYLLAVFLTRPAADGGKDFERFLRERVYAKFEEGDEPCDEGTEPDAARVRCEVPPFADPSAVPHLRRCLHELVSGRLLDDRSFVALQRLYAKLTAVRRRWPVFPRELDEAYCADPIENLFEARETGQRTSEMEWMAASLVYLESDAGAGDLAFAHLFWQVLRIRVRHYRHVVQRPLTPGLQWFIRFYGRVKPARQLISTQLQVASAAKICGHGLGLKAMEFRTSPRPDLSGMTEVVGQAVKAVAQLNYESVHLGGEGATHGYPAGEEGEEWVRRHGVRAPTEWGLVFHFTRERGGGAERGLAKARGRESHGDPGWKENVGYRYGRLYREKRREAHAFASMLRRFPWTLSLVRGLDLCSDELGVPMWVMAPLCRYVREVSRAASAHVQSEWGEELPPLRMTVHAGEEFVHLLGGLRRIDEAIEYLDLGQGDRLGHTIALGVNPEAWATRTSAIAVTCMERLLDLAWEWSFSTSRAINISASRIQFIIDQIERLSKEIFGEFAHPPQVARFAELLQDEEELRLLGFPQGPLLEMDSYVYSRRDEGAGRPPVEGDLLETLARALSGGREGEPAAPGRRESLIKQLHDMFKMRQGDEPWRLMYHYLIEPETFQRGQTLILVDPSFEAGALTMLQDELRKKIGSLGITVEINPSSNLLIGNLSDLNNHPLWRLKPPDKSSPIRPVALCVGSDDPLTFCTRTREEYQLVYDTLTLAGLSDEEARLWLDDVREAGLVSRFTLQVPHSPESIWTNMTVDVRHIRPLL